MQNHMTLRRRYVLAAPRRWPLTLFWVTALVGLGFLIGVAREAGPVTAPVSTTAPDTTVEEWHGNVRVGG